MTTTKTETAKPKKSLEQTLQLMKDKQKLFQIKVAKMEKDIEEKRNAASQVQRLKFAKLAEEAGILGLSDSILAKAFADIANRNGIKRDPVPVPAGEGVTAE